MASLLIDSHVFLWLLQEPEKIGTEAHDIISKSTVTISAASLWELSIKHQAGKLAFGPEELISAIETIGASTLPITERHVAAMVAITTTPHRDPFDRMLLAQAQSEGLVFMTADQILLSLKLPFVATAVR